MFDESLKGKTVDIISDTRGNQVCNTLVDKISTALRVLNEHAVTIPVGGAIHDEISQWDKDQWDATDRAFRPVASPLAVERQCESCIIARRDVRSPKITMMMPTNGKYPDTLRNIHRLADITHNSPLPVRLVLALDGVKLDDCNLNVHQATQIFEKSGLDYAVIHIPEGAQYTGALQIAFKKIVNEDDGYTGFLDDDVYFTEEDHYAILLWRIMHDEATLAVSGLAVDNDVHGNIKHKFFNIATSYPHLVRAKELGFKLDKPHLHAGTGSLMRNSDFAEIIDLSVKRRLLLGPYISVWGRLKGMMTPSLHDSLVLHPTRDTFFGWLQMVRKYYNTWGPLIEQTGADTSVYRTNYLALEQKAFDNILSDNELQLLSINKQFRRHFK